MQRTFWYILVLLLAGTACQQPMTPRTYPTEKGRAEVEIIQTGEGEYQLMRLGKPYFIKGAAGHGFLPELAQYGGNCIRTWGPDSLAQYLDQADSLGLTVMAGLWAIPGRQGMDYTDEKAVAAQKERIHEIVVAYRDHPALLMWNIGNEMDLFYEKDELYHAINELAVMIHEIDPDHPVTLSVGCRADWVSKVAALCPDIDILSVNVFSALDQVPTRLADPDYGWNGPYLITEWSHRGFWEVPMTDWDAPLEPASSVKLDENLSEYEAGVSADPDRCLGSFVFYWGHKQERTHTWYSMFTRDGLRTSRVDAVQYLWTGKWPVNRAPELTDIQIGEKKLAENNCYLDAASLHEALVEAMDPEGDELELVWEIMPEGDYRGTFGGDKEAFPEALSLKITPNGPKGITFTAPTEPGAYRLFVTAKDGKGGAGTINMPFFVVKGDF